MARGGNTGLTFGFAFLTIGTVWILAGSRNQTVVGVLEGALKGEPGPGERPVTYAGAGSTVEPNIFEGSKGWDLGQKGNSQSKESELRKLGGLKPGIIAVGAVVLTRFPGLTVTSSYRPGDDGHHGEGRALDLGGTTAEMDRAAKFISKYMTRMLTEGIYQGQTVSLSVQSKKQVPSSFWGASGWDDHIDHIHIAV